MQQTAIYDRKPYYYHLNGLKGIACLFVMVGHYFGIYYSAQSFIPPIRILDTLSNSAFSFLIDAGYWLYLFFVVSGYLVSKSKIESVRDLLSKVINRYLRLAFPILFSYLVIYLIYLAIGFHTEETSALFQCQWYQKFYLDSYTLFDVIMSPINVLIFQKCQLNSPYWVLRMMFISSLIIYLIKYLCNKLKLIEKHESFMLSALIVLSILSFVISSIISACLIGMIVSIFETSTVKTKSCYAFWFIFISVSILVLPGALKYSLAFAILIVFIPRHNVLNKVFSSKPLQFLGNISWGIYSFHWPIICSIGALLIICISSNLGLKNAYLVSFFIVTILTIFVSICFFYSLERVAAQLIKKVTSLFQKEIKTL